MTKEELKQEAKERADEYTNLRPFHFGYEEGYKNGAEPREMQIQIDAEHIIALQKQNGELTDKVKELEAQTSKAKNLLRDVLSCIDLTDCVNSDPRLILYDKIKSLINEVEK